MVLNNKQPLLYLLPLSASKNQRELKNNTIFHTFEKIKKSVLL